MRRARWAEALIYLPLLVPQAAFLFGLSVVLLRLGLSGGLTAVIWGLLIAPKASHRLTDPWRFVMEIVLFAVGAGALYLAGRPSAGAALFVIFLINRLLMILWSR